MSFKESGDRVGSDFHVETKNLYYATMLNSRVNLLTLDWLFPLELGAVITTDGALLC